MLNYAAVVSPKATPQTEPIPGSSQVPNSAGGYSWAVDHWVSLERFLILGAEGGTYYIQEKDLVKQNHQAVLKCIKEDGVRVVDVLEEISVDGRAPKNDPALFVLALVFTHGDEKAKRRASDSLLAVARIGTHIFHFVAFVNSLRGWGRSVKNAVARWYTLKGGDELAHQLVKYRQRDGWTHKDVLRLVHAKATTPETQSVFRWVVTGTLGSRTVTRKGAEPVVYEATAALPAIISAFEEVQKTDSEAKVVQLIRDHRLPREVIPTQWLNSLAVWEALLASMPLTALIRNLGKMSSIGLLKPLSEAQGKVVRSLEGVRKARVHPLTILTALKTYSSGHGDKGSLTWTPVPKVVDALDSAFYEAFQNVKPCGKPQLLALDVSGSMGGANIAGSPLTAREASAAMALITAATEPNTHIAGFSSGMIELNISPKQRLDDVVKAISGLPFDSTNCAMPMVYAHHHGLGVDGFVIYTDSETYVGDLHPSQAIKQYRNKSGRKSKLVVVGMCSNGFTIADPNDAGMLDVVGFDTATPGVIADFIRG